MPEIISARPSRILLISRDTGSLETMQEVLAEAGHRVLPSDHALEPADVLQLRPDLLVLDITTEIGWDYVRSFRSVACTSRIPILACTRKYPVASQLEATDGRSVLAILRRPFEKTYLLDAVECAIANQLRASKQARPAGCVAIDSIQSGIGRSQIR